MPSSIEVQKQPADGQQRAAEGNGQRCTRTGFVCHGRSLYLPIWKEQSPRMQLMLKIRNIQGGDGSSDAGSGLV